jgi:hypothetical protein
MNDQAGMIRALAELAVTLQAGEISIDAAVEILAVVMPDVFKRDQAIVRLFVNTLRGCIREQV